MKTNLETSGETKRAVEICGQPCRARSTPWSPTEPHRAHAEPGKAPWRPLDPESPPQGVPASTREPGLSLAQRVGLRG
eukprot:15451703-Alexandrium_andersonii.AAC.1